MPPAIDYRQTFLRHHVPTELDPPAEREEDGFREEILALDSLRYRLRQAFPDAAAEIHRLASRRRFFRTMPDDGPWRYMPVRVRPLSDDRGIPRDERDEYKDLTDLLCSPTKSRRGVLLTARSGAGKSTAMLKAFFDCFVGPDPLLGGYLPCYLRTFGKAREAQSTGHEVILKLLAEASRLQPCPSSEQIETWLNYSPPLLLFMDLNTADDDLRQVLRKAIVRFQEHFKGRHRWVIAYRAADRDDTLNYLQQTGFFGTYDLRHLDYTDALKYLDNVRRVEDELTNELDSRRAGTANRPAESLSINSAKLRQLFDRYGNDPDSLISTPLLMHFVSVIGIERAAAAESLAQLYAEVVEDYLNRDYGQFGRATTPYREVIEGSGLMNSEGRITIKVAMARVALAILAGGDTRLQRRGTLRVESVLDRLLADPNKFRQPHDWWPADDWWHEGRYYHDGHKGALHPEARRAIREFSFLRRDGDTFGFLHDSFLYYFAALAVRCREEPEIDPYELSAEPVRNEWCGKAVERMHQAPSMWRQAALFLGGMLTPEEMRALLPPLLTAEPAAGWFGVVSQIVRGRQRPGQDDTMLRQVERALSSRAPEVQRYPEALFPHVYNHLSWCEEPQATCHAFADGALRQAMNATGRPWLRTETPMPPLREEVFRCYSAINSLTVYFPGEFITGHADGTVRRWPVDSGEDVVLYRHEGEVRSVAVDVRDGSVLSGGDDWTLRRWRPGQDDAEMLYRHEGWVESLAADGRDGSVLSGGRDRKVRRWQPGQDDAQVLYRHEIWVRFVAVDVRVGSVLFGGGDRKVCRWQPGQDDAQVLYRHEDGVLSVAVDESADCLVSGGNDANLRLFRLAPRDFLMLLTPYSIRSIACSLKHNRIALALGDGRLVLVCVEPNVEALYSYPGQQKNPPPDAST